MRTRLDREAIPRFFSWVSSQVKVRAPGGARGVEAGVGTDPVTCFSDCESCNGLSSGRTSAMFPIQLMGLNWPALEERVERSGRWSSWVATEPVLAGLNGLDEVVAMVEDRADPGRADALLAALVRLGAVDGGNDQDAAQAVALLLANGSARLARQLRNL